MTSTGECFCQLVFEVEDFIATTKETVIAVVAVYGSASDTRVAGQGRCTSHPLSGRENVYAESQAVPVDGLSKKMVDASCKMNLVQDKRLLLVCGPQTCRSRDSDLA